MSQIFSRIHIKVTSPSVWSKFKEADDASFNLAELADKGKTSFVIDFEWSSEYHELLGIVESLAETLGKEGIIIADTTDLNVDPYDQCIFYFGTDVDTMDFDIYNGRKRCNMFFDTDINDIAGWINYGGFKVSEEEKKVLFLCGVSVSGKEFVNFSADINIPEKVYLRETSFENRPETIEKSILGEEVYFVHSEDSYDPLRLEVMSELGSLGYLPSNVSDQITPILNSNHLKYTAKIVEILPASQRNKHAKSSVVAINIVAGISEDELPVKKSVPKIEDRDKKIEADKIKAEEERKCAEGEIRKIEEKCKRKEEEARKAEEERKRIEEESQKAEKERQEAEKAAREAEEKRKEEERQKAEAAEKAEREEKLRIYNEAHENWEIECAEIETKRSEFMETELDKKKNEIELEIIQKRDIAIETATAAINEQKNRKTAAEAKLASLGIFKFKEKKEQQAIIEESSRLLAKAEADMANAASTFNKEMDEVDKKVRDGRLSISNKATKKFPLPAEPKKPE